MRRFFQSRSHHGKRPTCHDKSSHDWQLLITAQVAEVQAVPRTGSTSSMH
jgi:hypothetical protein